MIEIEIGDKLGMSIFIVVSWSNHRARMWVCQALEEAVVAEGPDSWVSTMLGTVLQRAKKLKLGAGPTGPLPHRCKIWKGLNQLNQVCFGNVSDIPAFTCIAALRVMCSANAPSSSSKRHARVRVYQCGNRKINLSQTAQGSGQNRPFGPIGLNYPKVL